MSLTFTWNLPIAPPATIRPDLAVVCLFSLLGLALSAIVLSWISPETSSLMFTAFG